MNIALLGYGKMGQIIESLATQAGHQIVFKSTSNKSEGDLHLADVAIEFSTPEAAPNNLKRCFEAQIPVVCGTTAWLDHWDEIIAHCTAQQGALLYASNFSIGVQIFFEMQRHLSQIMSRQKAYKISIQESHHTQKKDAPSGTAITLAEITLDTSNYNKWVLGEAQNEDELPIQAIREPNIPGTHKVFYQSAIDQITIEHKAHSREGFASGALLAAQWLIGKTGIYSMKDVLHLSDNKHP
ncbi:MAG TPA: 4-hydroxy-tetrahydrodipicolinate reductase [Flavobacteriaceae bacterium]|nr:4-hydroxy-tetrahydrodipicolinate reductase [Flavobacteriaceae bacterium]